MCHIAASFLHLCSVDCVDSLISPDCIIMVAYNVNVEISNYIRYTFPTLLLSFKVRLLTWLINQWRFKLPLFPDVLICSRGGLVSCKDYQAFRYVSVLVWHSFPGLFRSVCVCSYKDFFLREGLPEVFNITSCHVLCSKPNACIISFYWLLSSQDLWFVPQDIVTWEVSNVHGRAWSLLCMAGEVCDNPSSELWPVDHRLEI